MIILRYILKELNKHIFFENSSFDAPFRWKIQLAFSILDSSQPLSFVIAAITPKHLPILISQVLGIISFINISIRPCEDSIAVFFIVSVISLVFICVARSFLPNSLSLSHSIFKMPFEKAARCPVILSIPIWLAFRIGSFVKIAVRKLFNSLAIL